MQDDSFQETIPSTGYLDGSRKRGSRGSMLLEPRIRPATLWPKCTVDEVGKHDLLTTLGEGLIIPSDGVVLLTKDKPRPELGHGKRGKSSSGEYAVRVYRGMKKNGARGV
ncbi:hypothetical protein KM043_017890 [Ampulex compressa]|nr:hypothetical protein KM043_017890 [Ampulex compressa]